MKKSDIENLFFFYFISLTISISLGNSIKMGGHHASVLLEGPDLTPPPLV